MSHVSLFRRAFVALVCLVVAVLILISNSLSSFTRYTSDVQGHEVQRWQTNTVEELGCRTQHKVQTITSWNAPIMWTGTFDPVLSDKDHAKSSVALTVFALGWYLDEYLEKFLISAEQHFMPGLPVTHYVFTDTPEKVPRIALGPRRHLKVVVVRHTQWQDVPMTSMKSISNVIQTEISLNFTHVFCFEVDQEFQARFGSEALGESVALIHARFYKRKPDEFMYVRNPASKAFLETGDFYYRAAIFGGTWRSVKNLADSCHQGIMEDMDMDNTETLWHHESHLNKYFWLHKPSKLLSPEYCWDLSIEDSSDICVVRLVCFSAV